MGFSIVIRPPAAAFAPPSALLVSADAAASPVAFFPACTAGASERIRDAARRAVGRGLMGFLRVHKILHVGADSHPLGAGPRKAQDRKSTRLNSSHLGISYAVFCL